MTDDELLAQFCDLQGIPAEHAEALRGTMVFAFYRLRARFADLDSILAAIDRALGLDR